MYDRITIMTTWKCRIIYTFEEKDASFMNLRICTLYLDRILIQCIYIYILYICKMYKVEV